MSTETAPTGDAGTETETGLDENVAGALTYLFGFVTGILFFIVEEDNEFVRFHAAQSIITFAVLFALSFVLSFGIGFLAIALAFVPGMGAITSLFSLVGYAVNLVILGAWLFLMFKAYSGERFEVPVVADYAKNMI